MLITPKITWYFDFISPYAYIQCEQLKRLPPQAKLIVKPVLFAALLKHWGQLGPAEIAPKRVFMFQHIAWEAQQRNIQFKLPPAHPFNPLPALRLAIALHSEFDAVKNIFRHIWAQGNTPDDPTAMSKLATTLGDANAMERTNLQSVKDQLKQNTDEAIANNVFGVPTLTVNGKNFWGSDSLNFLLDYLQKPDLFDNDAMRRAETIPIGQERRR